MPTSPDPRIADYFERVRQALREMGIPDSLATERRQSLQFEGDDLISIGVDQLGREQRLERRAAAAWCAMRAAAGEEGVELFAASAYRSFDYQRQIIARKLAAGQALEQILTVSALPGFSEHHTGRAIDIGTPGSPPITAAFEVTPAYAWLLHSAANFGFRMSYPRGNPHGVVFEPWHWLFDASSKACCAAVNADGIE